MCWFTKKYNKLQLAACTLAMSNVSREVLVGFIEEAQSYLPEIRDSIAAYRKDSSDAAALEMAHRHAHTIKGAAAMIGVSPLSHIAYYLEETLEDIAVGTVELGEPAVRYLREAVNGIELYLAGLENGNVRDVELLATATHGYFDVHGMPADDETIAEIVAEVTTQPEAQQPPVVEEFVTTPEHNTPTILLDDEFMAELREAFVEEATDHLQQIARSLNALNVQSDDREALGELRRSVHTLKGASATVGFSQIADLSHRMEDLLDGVEDGERVLNRPSMELLFDSADALDDLLRDNSSPDQLPSLQARFGQLLEHNETADEPLEILAFEGVEQPTLPAPQSTAKQVETNSIRTTSEVVRVPLERLDELTRLTSEFVITRTTLEQRINDLTRHINELAPSLERLQRIAAQLDSDYHELTYASQNSIGTIQPVANVGVQPNSLIASEFDALEFDRYTELYMLSRELTETSSDIRTVHNDLRTLLGDFDSVLTRQGRLSGEVQDKLMRTRMVPLATIVTRLQRTVRVVARQQGKQVNLLIEGDQIELDKKVLEEMADPLLHILRNAVDHGIEPSELRVVKGKSEYGTIRIRAYYEGNQVVITVQDDGAGIDNTKLRAKAVQSGYLSEGDSADVTDAALQQLIFQPGFSTAETISDVSGRGVGMDVVKASVNRLKGTVRLNTAPDEGTQFMIRLPLTLAVMRGLLIQAAGATFALPLSSVSQILRLEGEEIVQIGRNPVIRVGKTITPIKQLGALLGGDEQDLSERKRLPVLIVNAGDQQVALIADEIVEGREIVIKTLGNHLRQVHGIAGATLMGDGSVVLILDPAELIEERDATQFNWSAPRKAIVPSKTLNILVVDDSVSVRKVVSNMVKNAGWTPTPARDGVEALEQIQQNKPDAILLDIEMPRMNGFELTATLRANEETRDIPIVMLTSRSGNKHRRKAFDLGVNDYLVKPYREDELLDAVRKIVGGL